jgi:hypothetical protein
MPKIISLAKKFPHLPKSRLLGRERGRTGEERTVTRGERFPPTPERGQGYVIVDRTKNKSGQSK